MLFVCSGLGTNFINNGRTLATRTRRWITEGWQRGLPFGAFFCYRQFLFEESFFLAIFEDLRDVGRIQLQHELGFVLENVLELVKRYACSSVVPQAFPLELGHVSYKHRVLVGRRFLLSFRPELSCQRSILLLFWRGYSVLRIATVQRVSSWRFASAAGLHTPCFASILKKVAAEGCEHVYLHSGLGVGLCVRV